MTPEMLLKLLDGHAPTIDVDIARAFLVEPELRLITHTESAVTVGYLLGILRIRAQSVATAGRRAHGLSGLFAALEALSPSERLTMCAYEGSKLIGQFWTSDAENMIGFALIEKLGPAEVQVKLDWFRQHMR